MGESMAKEILVMDNEPDMLKSIKEILENEGYRVSCFNTGQKVIKALKTRKFDLLILDMIMDPGMDGLDTYRSILEIHPKQKAIIVSGFSESDRVHAAQSLGAGTYVRKPYVIEKLGLAVRTELDIK